MGKLKYKIVYDFLKERIQHAELQVGDFLPSENELCKTYSITRTTARKALDELVKDGFIERQQGKGSVVVERRKSLGLLSVKGFSEVVGENVKTIFLQKPTKENWNQGISFPVKEVDKQSDCLYFERLRFVGLSPVMLEKNWFSEKALPGFIGSEFVDGSFFKTLSKKYLIEIVGSSHELRAEKADLKLAELLQIDLGYPVLHISIQFISSNKMLTIYSELYCNTQKFPIGNSYNL